MNSTSVKNQAASTMPEDGIDWSSTHGQWSQFWEHQLQLGYQNVSYFEMMTRRLFEGKPLSSGLRKAYRDGRVMPAQDKE